MHSRRKSSYVLIRTPLRFNRAFITKARRVRESEMVEKLRKSKEGRLSCREDFFLVRGEE